MRLRDTRLRFPLRGSAVLDGGVRLPVEEQERERTRCKPPGNRVYSTCDDKLQEKLEIDKLETEGRSVYINTR